ncbi:hypothetical protein [Streptacidiphilus sp. EB129]|uniref:hypothetical protein n=1 Tax=Streptacidiphilus sp. EB129 TaxID=3156262 RepID=UPI003517B514
MATVPTNAQTGTATITPVNVSLWLGAGGLAILLVFLTAVPWVSGVPSLGAVVTPLVTALLGAVVNPSVGFPQKVWTGVGVVALFAMASSALALLVFPGHAAAVPALSASVAALAGLMVDTRSVTHGQPPADSQATAAKH